MNNLKKDKLYFVCVLVLLLNSTILRAQGPNAPEAASFEPVDATDMVNLVTGDFTYVLPLLNVPSPEGGYPIALAYHSGIAMDQEASWTGLGWNLNPGAINRSVNGYPDDYNNSLLSEYFFDEGDEVTTYSLSLGFGSNKGLSVGLGFSWGSHKSLGGTVSIGYSPTKIGGGLGGGISAGENGVGLNGSYGFKGGHSLGIALNSSGNFSGSYGFNTNSAGFGISTNGTFRMNLNHKSGNGNSISTGISLASSGLSINGGVTNKTGNVVDGGAGTGLSIQFENTVSMGDYTTKTSGWSIPLIIPTNIGVISLTFGKQKFKYWLGKNETNLISGPVYFSNNIANNETWVVMGNGTFGPVRHWYLGTFSSQQEAQEAADNADSPWCPCYVELIENEEAFMDIYEVPLNSNEDEFANDTEVNLDNATFPSYDKYNVQAQGLSGSMSSRLFENGNLFGLSNKENDQGYKLSYSLDGGSSTIPAHAKFDEKPYFYLDNEISTYIAVNEASYNTVTNNAAILDYYSSGVDPNAKQRRNNATYVDYYTVEDLTNNYNYIKSQGYLLPNASTFSPFDLDHLPESSIAAFKVTAADGKTYHYSLPVYNHEVVTRTHGSIPGRRLEHESYFEKRQLEPYVTHWLLTAITGPDYFDVNNNGQADKGDFGYWTAFEYGKWSDAFAWKTPYGKDYFENEEDPNIKTQIRGRKEVYYLDRIKTRTHTALFVKSERNDSKSEEWAYRSVNHVDNLEQSYANYESLPLRFTIPSQKSLRLDKIILIKTEDDISTLSHGGAGYGGFVDIEFNNSDKPSESAWYNMKERVIDVGDSGLSTLESKAIKVIDFNYNYDLAIGSPNTTSSNIGRLTLNSVDFKGKSGNQVMPPYGFTYNNLGYLFDINDKDGFGYYKDDNTIWSLNEITTPVGGKILINYENHSTKSVLNSTIKFSSFGGEEFEAIPISNNLTNTSNALIFDIKSIHDLNIQLGDQLFTQYSYCPGFSEVGFPTTVYYYIGNSTVINDFGNNHFRLQANGTSIESFGDLPENFQIGFDCFNSAERLSIDFVINDTNLTTGGTRVGNIATTDGVTSYRTEYNYGENEDGVGYISYLPFASELEEELPYSTELPAPKVMYEYVSVESFGTDNLSEGRMQYKFNVMKEKDPNAIKFGNFYRIETYGENQHYNSAADKEVEIKSYQVHDNLAALGQLLEVLTFNKQQQLLSKIENVYYSPIDPTPNNVGVTKEAYQTYKEVDYTNSSTTDKWLINSSARIKYPSLLKYSTEYNNGYKIMSEFGELDPITGQALEVVNTDSWGNRLKSEIIPAYTIPAYGFNGYSMGSKVDNITNKNMLTQQAMSKSYIEVDGNWKETGVGITTWNNNWSYVNVDGSLDVLPNDGYSLSKKVWRKHKTYIWDGELNPDGTLKDFVFSESNFNWTVPQDGSDDVYQADPKWKNISTTTLYDHYSMPLQARDINGNSLTTKMTDGNSKVNLVCNSEYGEAFFTSVEYIHSENGYQSTEYLDQGIVGASLRSDTYAHTGKYSVKLNFGDEFGTTLKANNHRSGDYKLSVWIHKSSYLGARVMIGSSGSFLQFNGEVIFAGDWVLMNHTFKSNSSVDTNVMITTVNGNLYVDDYRVHPISSTMTSYVYNEWDELEAILDSNNLATKYEYDSQGRLKRTYSEIVDASGVIGGFKLSSENDYGYKNQQN